MLCPGCKQSTTYVIDSRDINAFAIRRRRECADCSYRFTTYEKTVPIKIKVEKRSSSKELYDREKIFKGVALATEKLNIDEDKINDIVDCVEHKIIQTQENPISSAKIGKIVLEELRNLDKVAYLRFASVYRGFSSIKSFEKELKKLG